MEEVWKDIPGYEGRYQVSDQGRVKSNTRVLRPCKVSGGYLAVSLGKNNSRTIHRLVALAFYGPSENSSQLLVLHGDGDRQNNTLANLRYGSHLDNAADAKKHGTQVRGPRQHASKLSVQDVEHIRSCGKNAYQLAHMYSVTRQCIHLILTRKNWRHV